MPPADQPCQFDAIDVSQFDFEVFMIHYALHPRPLLIRGGAQFPPHIAKAYTRAGLLDAAGEQKVSAVRFPGSREYDGKASVVTKDLAEYVDSLGERSGSTATKRLHFMVKRLPKDEVLLNFSATMPNIL